MPNYLITDVETFLIKTDLWKPPEDNPKAFPPISFQGIAAIGGLYLEISNKGNRCSHIGTFGTTGDESHELSRIEAFLKYYRKNQPIIVTFNGRRFDIPVLWMRAMHHGVSIPEFFEYDFAYKFSHKKHYDFSEMMFDHGAVKPEKLAYLCSIVGLPGKPEIDGSMVHGIFDAGEYQKIASYVQCDVIEEALMFLRYLHVRGEISTVVLNNLIHSIKNQAMGLDDPLISRLIGLTDFSKLEVRYGQPLAKQEEMFGDAGIKNTEETETEEGIPF